MYCKFTDENAKESYFYVLIVAKCIVNLEVAAIGKHSTVVLIVAKCIVNVKKK